MRADANLGLKYDWQCGEHVKPDMDANLAKLGALFFLSVISRTTTLPTPATDPLNPQPGDPAEGDRYIVPTGANAESVAVLVDNAWVYYPPADGWRARVADDDNSVVYKDGEGWAVYADYKKHNEAAADPAITDDSSAGYERFSTWFNTATNKLFVCAGATAGAAVWLLSAPASNADNLTEGTISDAVHGQRGGGDLHADATPSADGFMPSADKQKVDNIAVTQPVDLDALDLAVAALDSAVVPKGNWDASTGSFPANAQAGWLYYVTVAGTVDGVSFDIDDRIICLVDNASTTVYANNWLKRDYTDQVLSVAGKTGTVALDKGDVGLGNVLNVGSYSKAEADAHFVSPAEMTYNNGLPTEFSAVSHMANTRNVFPVPYDGVLVTNGAQFELKFLNYGPSDKVIKTAPGVSQPVPAPTGNYGVTQTITPWGNGSGGYPTQLMWAGNGMFIRHANDFGNSAVANILWQPSAAYTAGQNRHATTAPKRKYFYFECTTAGTTGATEPAWPATNGGTVNDGTVVWTARPYWGAWTQMFAF